MPKPEIIVLSKDTDTEGFQWLSNGWNDSKRSHTPKAKALMAKAAKCIAKGDTVPEVIGLLEKAGFKVTRSEEN